MNCPLCKDVGAVFRIGSKGYRDCYRCTCSNAPGYVGAKQKERTTWKDLYEYYHKDLVDHHGRPIFRVDDPAAPLTVDDKKALLKQAMDNLEGFGEVKEPEAKSISEQKIEVL